MAAYLRTVMNSPAVGEDVGADLSDADENYRRVGYHEAGHAVVSEVLCPGSITLINVRGNGSDCGGFTDYFGDGSASYLYREKLRIIGTLGGIAATEQKFGLSNTGGSRDLDTAFNSVRDLVVNDCICGFHLHSNEYGDSERLQSEQEQVISSEVERYFRKAKEILSLNSEFLEELAAALAKKTLLSAVDVKKIRERRDIKRWNDFAALAGSNFVCMLRKNPYGAKILSPSFGSAFVFYPEASDKQAASALLFDLNPIDLAGE